MAELPVSQLVFATDYPQAVRDTDEVLASVDAVPRPRRRARTVLNGGNAEELIPNLRDRRKHVAPDPVGDRIFRLGQVDRFSELRLRRTKWYSLRATTAVKKIAIALPFWDILALLFHARVHGNPDLLGHRFDGHRRPRSAPPAYCCTLLRTSPVSITVILRIA